MIKTVKHYLVATKWDWEKEFTFALQSCPPIEASNNQRYVDVLIREMDIDLDIPDDFDPRPAQIAALEAQRQKARADFELLMNTIDGKIQSLKCIEHKPE